MDASMPFLAAYGTLIIFIISFANQIGLPLAGEILFLQLGALVAGGKLSLWEALLPPVLGTILGNLCLYAMGRRSGLQLLGFVSRYSLEPESLGSETKRRFGRWGLKFLLVSQFFPLSWTLPALSGMTRVGFMGFFAFSSVGALVWVAAFTAAGYLGSHQIDAIVSGAIHLIGTLGGVSVLICAIWVTVKLVRRQRILRLHHRTRMSPERLKAKLDAGDPVVIVDVRTHEALSEFPFVIPGALVIPAEEIDGRRHEIPPHQDLILYCSCRNELSSARVALKLNKEGLDRIHALEGGIDAWRALGFPVQARIPEPQRS